MITYDHAAITEIIERDHANKYRGGKALIVLGGPSGKDWQNLRDQIRPDVMIGVNGVNGVIPDLDYWLLMENMLKWNKEAKNGNKRAQELMKPVQRLGPRVRLVNKKTYRILNNHDGALPLQRGGPQEVETIFSNGFTLRKYGTGLWKGALMKRPDVIGELKLPVGTVGLQALHFAGILGCAEVHTIGYDLYFPSAAAHHFYKHPLYESNYLWDAKKMFTTYKGFSTMFFWQDAADYLKQVESIFERDGLRWIDHGHGLLSAVGLECTRMQ
jgi:hypothetical protein